MVIGTGRKIHMQAKRGKPMTPPPTLSTLNLFYRTSPLQDDHGEPVKNEPEGPDGRPLTR